MKVDLQSNTFKTIYNQFLYPAAKNSRYIHFVKTYATTERKFQGVPKVISIKS